MMKSLGYNRDREALPQLNLNMVHARDLDLPLYFRVIPGSVPDVATLAATADILRALGLSDFDFSLDRGFYSSANLWHFHDNGIGFTIGAPLGHEASAVLAAVAAMKVWGIRRLYRVIFLTQRYFLWWQMTHGTLPTSSRQVQA